MADGAESGRWRDPGRQQNLASLLRRVHAAPASRSELTRSTGLNRSTIAALVAELVDRGLVVEDEPGVAGSVGRPSPIVRPSDRAVAIAVHPEIDSIRVATVFLGGRVLEAVRIPCDAPPRPDEAVAAVVPVVAELVGRLGGSRTVVGVGVAVPGLVRVADGVVRLAPHLDWHDVPIAARLGAALRLPVRAANEGSLGAAAEWLFGAGRGVDDLLYVNGGASGIGGGVVAGGVPLAGASGHAGEIGHVVVSGGGGRDTAGLRNTLEAHVTRDALLAALGIAAPQAEDLGRALVGDRSPAVDAVVAAQIDALAEALGGVVNVLGSERVVLGGFLAALAATDGRRLRERFEHHLLAPLVDEVDLRTAELGPDLLLVGAAGLAFERVFAELPSLA